MEILLAHLWGDFMLQTSWMANHKYTRWWPAIAHGLVYTMMFAFLTLDWWRLLIIGGTHVVIDHYRLAGLWARLINEKWREPQPVIPAWCITAIDQAMHLTINYLVLAIQLSAYRSL